MSPHQKKIGELLNSFRSRKPKSARKMTNTHGFFVLFCCTASLFLAEAQRGFLNIDCGLTGTPNYTNPADNLNQTPDDGYVESGVNMPIDPTYSSLKDTEHRVYTTVRYFPNYTRNCYQLLTTLGPQYKYLLRASFMYGNYDRKNSPPSFDIYLGVDLWDTVKLDNNTHHYRSELIAEATSTFFHVCLVNTGNGTPFISGLKLRPLTPNMYAPASSTQALMTYMRVDVGATSSTATRWPYDVFDRRWDPDYGKYGTPKKTSLNVTENSQPSFGLPMPVMQTAAYSKEIVITWPGGVDHSYYLFLDFADVLLPSHANSRQMEVRLNGQNWNSTPVYYCRSTVLYSRAATTDSQYSFSIRSANPSDEGAVLNSFEVYQVLQLTGYKTHPEDASALQDIKGFYNLKKNWMGDPCFPVSPWDGVTCDNASPPRIVTLDLSNSELSGSIAPQISKLTELRRLNLSRNNLKGPVPPFLRELQNVFNIDLSSNDLSGPIPPDLQERIKNGVLVLSLDGNPQICHEQHQCNQKGKRRKNVIVISVVVSLVVTTLVLFLVISVIKRRKQDKLGVRGPPQDKEIADNLPRPDANLRSTKSGTFIYSEVVEMTNNFEKVIGRGGSCTVFYGCLKDGREVAVKKVSPILLERGTKEFAAEVRMLMQVHHKHLTPFIGYCADEKEMILIYEYMANGNLHKRLSDETADVLNWQQRLHIALDAAIGLEYLHSGCTPAFIHRDVKSSNILINENLEAKISDFGLSKSVVSDEITHITTAVAGTAGYLDPEYLYTNKVTEKSDVYGFGVVLFELITGRPAISTNVKGERVPIVQLVLPELMRGDIRSIIDPRLQGQYDINSMWKVAETAMTCTQEKSVIRPIMTEVVAELKEAMDIETSRERTISDRKWGKSTSLSFGRESLSTTTISDADSSVYPSAR
ncbi:putative leucine-rich repeat receptor-like protein kinase At2g19210 isoform X1 [Nymphaea colorata]|nr:putative leucine-rich repeat receptor-like protein kinase At2g19210 isoform X1 [Nymphaea colorata]